MGHAAREHDRVGDAELAGERLEVGPLAAVADEQRPRAAPRLISSAVARR